MPPHVGQLIGAAGDLPIPAQLGLLVPFLLALAWVGKWLFSKLDEAQKAKDALYEKIMDQAIPALNASATAVQEMLSVAKALNSELEIEREARIRMEERLK